MNAAQPNLTNQTLFVHGFSISLGEGLWGKLFGDVSVDQIVEFQKGKSRSEYVPFGAQGSSLSSFLGLGSRTSQGTNDAILAAENDRAGRQSMAEILEPHHAAHDAAFDATFPDSRPRSPAQDDEVHISHFSPTPTILHPSQLVNSYLTQKACSYYPIIFSYQMICRLGSAGKSCNNA
jgi:hypothetical protein